MTPAMSLRRQRRVGPVAHTAPSSAHARPGSALRSGALRTAVPALRTECPAPRSQEAALHIIKEKRSQETFLILEVRVCDLPLGQVALGRLHRALRH